jgi:hypothetical protein
MQVSRGAIPQPDPPLATPVFPALASTHRHCQNGIITKIVWIVEFLNEEVKASLDAFPLDIPASFQRIVELIHTDWNVCASLM